ncbi:MAG TPA: hypothetical protein VFY13_07460 [Luteolibacter sp.]|nr:hypothetical protein [Luteolibacter sp.]
MWCEPANAQTPMAQSWSTRISHIMTSCGQSDDGNSCYGSNAQEFTLLSAASGGVLWHKRFQDIDPGFAKVDNQLVLWDANLLILIVRELGNDLIGAVDLNTGNLIWSTRAYRHVRPGSIIHVQATGALAFISQDGVVLVSPESGGEISRTSGFSGSPAFHACMPDGNLLLLMDESSASAPWSQGVGTRLVKINLHDASVHWVAMCAGAIEYKLTTGEPLADLRVEAGKVLLYTQSIQTFDYDTGVSSWSASWRPDFDNHFNVLGAPPDWVGSRSNSFYPYYPVDVPRRQKQYGWYGAVAKPLISGNDVYVIDTPTKSTQYLKKYDLTTGALLWTSPAFTRVTAVPKIHLVGDAIILQMGGLVQCQYRGYLNRSYSTYNNYNYTDAEWIVRDVTIQPCSLMAFRSMDGGFAWQSARIAGGITDIIPNGNRIIVAGKSILYALDLATGMNAYAVRLNGDRIGNVVDLAEGHGEALVIGEKGVAHHRLQDGALVDRGVWGVARLVGSAPSLLLFRLSNAHIVAYDDATGLYRIYQPLVGCLAQLSADGGWMYAFEKDTITRLSPR